MCVCVSVCVCVCGMSVSDGQAMLHILGSPTAFQERLTTPFEGTMVSSRDVSKLKAQGLQPLAFRTVLLQI